MGSRPPGKGPHGRADRQRATKAYHNHHRREPPLLLPTPRSAPMFARHATAQLGSCRAGPGRSRLRAPDRGSGGRRYRRRAGRWVGGRYLRRMRHRGPHRAYPLDTSRCGPLSPAHAAAGTTPTGSPAPRCRTPPYAQPGPTGPLPRGHGGRAVAQHPGHRDQARPPLVPVLAALRVTPPLRTPHPHGTIRTLYEPILSHTGA
jgi:hypothetical protein